MKEKKHRADWYIAATHCLTGGIVFGLIFKIIGEMLNVTIIHKKGCLAFGTLQLYG